MAHRGLRHLLCACFSPASAADAEHAHPQQVAAACGSLDLCQPPQLPAQHPDPSPRRHDASEHKQCMADKASITADTHHAPSAAKPDAGSATGMPCSDAGPPNRLWSTAPLSTATATALYDAYTSAEQTSELFEGTSASRSTLSTLGHSTAHQAFGAPVVPRDICTATWSHAASDRTAQQPSSSGQFVSPAVTAQLPKAPVETSLLKPTLSLQASQPSITQLRAASRLSGSSIAASSSNHPAIRTLDADPSSSTGSPHGGPGATSSTQPSLRMVGRSMDTAQLALATLRASKLQPCRRTTSSAALSVSGSPLAPGRRVTDYSGSEAQLGLGCQHSGPCPPSCNNSSVSKIALASRSSDPFKAAMSGLRSAGSLSVLSSQQPAAKELSRKVQLMMQSQGSLMPRLSSTQPLGSRPSNGSTASASSRLAGQGQAQEWVSGSGMSQQVLLSTGPHTSVTSASLKRAEDGIQTLERPRLRPAPRRSSTCVELVPFPITRLALPLTSPVKDAPFTQGGMSSAVVTSSVEGARAFGTPIKSVNTVAAASQGSGVAAVVPRGMSLVNMRDLTASCPNTPPGGPQTSATTVLQQLNQRQLLAAAGARKQREPAALPHKAASDPRAAHWTTAPGDLVEDTEDAGSVRRAGSGHSTTARARLLSRRSHGQDMLLSNLRSSAGTLSPSQYPDWGVSEGRVQRQSSTLRAKARQISFRQGPGSGSHDGRCLEHRRESCPDCHMDLAKRMEAGSRALMQARADILAMKIAYSTAERQDRNRG